MLTKSSSLNRKQWIVTIFTIILLWATFVSQAKAQQPDETKPKTGKTETDRITVALPDSTEEITDNTTSELPEIELGKPKRVKPERAFYLTAQYAQLFDDNVLLREKDGPSDTIYMPQIGFGAVRVRSRSLMRIDYLGGAEIHRRFSDFDGVSHSLDAGLEYDLTKRITLFASDRYYQRPVTAGFGIFGTSPNTGPAALNVLVPTRSIINDLAFGLEYQLSRSSNLRAGYGYTLSRFNNRQLIDTDVHVLEVGYTRQATQTSEFDLEYRASFFSGDGNLSTNTFMPSLRYNRKNGFRMRLGAGPQFATSSISGNNLFLAAVAELGYKKQRTAYLLSFNMGVGEGGGLATVTRNQSVFGTIEHLLGKKIQTVFRLGYSHAVNSLGTTTSSFLPAGTANNELIFESRVDYRLWDKMGLFFSYLHSAQNGSGSGNNDLSRNLFTIGISFDTRRSERRVQSYSDHH